MSCRHFVAIFSNTTKRVKEEKYGEKWSELMVGACMWLRMALVTLRFVTAKRARDARWVRFVTVDWCSRRVDNVLVNELCWLKCGNVAFDYLVCTIDFNFIKISFYIASTYVWVYYP